MPPAYDSRFVIQDSASFALSYKPPFIQVVSAISNRFPKCMPSIPRHPPLEVGT